MNRLRPLRPRQDAWRLFLNLSLTSFVGGLFFALIGAWTAAALTFAFGLLLALAAAWRLRRRSPQPPHLNAPAVLRATKERRR
jgi:membrane protein implicated in regulation of membrane protease activity